MRTNEKRDRPDPENGQKFGSGVTQRIVAGLVSRTLIAVVVWLWSHWT